MLHLLMPYSVDLFIRSARQKKSIDSFQLGLVLQGKAQTEEIILNAVLLECVLDIDELLYEAFAPLKTRRLIYSLEPLPTESTHIHSPHMMPYPISNPTTYPISYAISYPRLHPIPIAYQIQYPSTSYSVPNPIPLQWQLVVAAKLHIETIQDSQ